MQRLPFTGRLATSPRFSTLSRRQRTLKASIPYRETDGPLPLLLDSTGIKAEGAGRH